MEGNIMLVLTRKSGQEIVIDGGIRIIVLDVQGNRVQVGISAPAEVKVYRKEIQERNKEVCRPQARR
jgi:carbon storage regulator